VAPSERQNSGRARTATISGEQNSGRTAVATSGEQNSSRTRTAPAGNRAKRIQRKKKRIRKRYELEIWCFQYSCSNDIHC
jgi:hypothetical protein